MTNQNNINAAAWRNRLLAMVIVAASAALPEPEARDAFAQGLNSPDGTRLFRIGTGGAQGTYFPVGALIAHAISDNNHACYEEDGCGVPGVLAVAQQSNGSVSNVEAISAGVLEAGLVQADVAHWAYTGTGVFADKRKRADIRAIASLYQESVHVVVARRGSMRTLRDLEGRRVSLDEPGSGTLVDARIVLEAYGIKENQLKTVYIKPQYAAEKLTDGTLDAFFIVAGFPTKSVLDLTLRSAATLVPIEREVARRIERMYPFLTPSEIPGDIYPGVPTTGTISVHAQLLVSASLPDDIAYRITRTLWSERTLRMLREGHPKGSEITLESALRGIPIPLHPGAERYYRERGLLPAQSQGSQRTEAPLSTPPQG